MLCTCRPSSAPVATFPRRRRAPHSAPPRLQVLLQAMPERGRQIGVMLALGLEPATWQRIAQDMPDLVPRGMSGYRRFA